MPLGQTFLECIASDELLLTLAQFFSPDDAKRLRERLDADKGDK
jgi:hypothetical protein